MKNLILFLMFDIGTKTILSKYYTAMKKSLKYELFISKITQTRPLAA